MLCLTWDFDWFWDTESAPVSLFAKVISWETLTVLLPGVTLVYCATVADARPVSAGGSENEFKEVDWDPPDVIAAFILLQPVATAGALDGAVLPPVLHECMVACFLRQRELVLRTGLGGVPVGVAAVAPWMRAEPTDGHWLLFQDNSNACSQQQDLLLYNLAF